LNVVNRHLDQPLEVEIEAQDMRFTGTVEVAEVNGPEIKAQNDFGSTKVKTVTRRVTADGRRMVYRFPAHSFTMLKVKLAEVGEDAQGNGFNSWMVKQCKSVKELRWVSACWQCCCRYSCRWRHR
jgi:hypothetical protein